MRKLENKKADEIGKMLVKAGTMSSREIDRIVADPRSFEAVRLRIALGEIERPASDRWIFRPAIVASLSVAVIAVAVVAFGSLKSGNSKQIAVAPAQPANTQSDLPKRSIEPDRIVSPKIPAEDGIRPERAVSKTPISNLRVSRQQKRPSVRVDRFTDNFYAVSYAGDPHETERGGRIVRVDIPRSTLFAMGINVPLENESATVKADLLIGNDGVTRAIRVVE